MKWDLSNSEKYVGQPEFSDTNWCWLEVYQKGENDYEIIPQFYAEGVIKKSRSLRSVEVSKLLCFQVIHNTGKLVQFETDFSKVKELIYFYRNVRSFDSMSGQQGSGDIRYPIQGFSKLDATGKVVSWQNKLLPDGDVITTDNYL